MSGARHADADTIAEIERAIAERRGIADCDRRMESEVIELARHAGRLEELDALRKLITGIRHRRSQRIQRIKDRAAELAGGHAARPAPNAPAAAAAPGLGRRVVEFLGWVVLANIISRVIF